MILAHQGAAYGIAKIIRFGAKLERSEELLVRFHGYSHLERFGAEGAAAFQRLTFR